MARTLAAPIASAAFGAFVALLASASAACGGQDTPEPVAPSNPPRVVAPSAGGPCVLSARSWAERPPQRLAVRDHGAHAVEVYGNIHDAKLTLGPSPRLTFFAGPVALAGYAEPTWVEVHAREPVALGPVLVASAFRDLSRDIRHWPDSANDSAKVSIEPPSGVELAQREFASIPCSALTLETRTFNPFAALGDPATAKHAALKAGRRVALLSTARGPVAAHVTITAAPQPVNVFAQEGAFSHVAFGRGTVLVHGWVGADDLEPPSAASDETPQGFVTVGTNADRFDAPAWKEERVCPHDVFLSVLEPRGRGPQPLGRIPAEQKIGIVLWDHALTTVFIQEAGIFPVSEGTLVVQTKELDGCKAP